METKKIYTNKIDFTLNIENILEDYEIIELKNTNTNKKMPYIKLWEQLKQDISVISYYNYGNCIYLLCKKEEINNLDIDKLEDFKIVANLVNILTIKKIKKYVILNLLIGLFGTNQSFFSIGEFQNGYYLIHKKYNNKIICLRFSVSKDLLLILNVITFSKSKFDKKSKKAKNYYVIENNKLSKVINAQEVKEDLFIKGNRFKSKNKIYYYDFQENFLNSKVGYIAKFVELINKQLINYLSFNLIKEEFCVFESSKDKENKLLELKNNINKCLKNYKQLNIIDYENKLDDDFKKDIINKLETYLDNSIKFNWKKEVDKTTPSIIFISSKEDYSDSNIDPYKFIKKENKLTQIVNYGNKMEQTVLEAVLKELVIKIEIATSEPYLTNKWVDFINYTFFMRIKTDEDFVYTKLSLNDLEIQEQELTMLDEIKLRSIIEKVSYESDIELIAFKDNDYFIISKTRKFILPNFDKCLNIYNDFINKNEKPRLRRVIYRKDTLNGLSGINYHKDDYSMEYYSANVLNPDIKMSKGIVVRRIDFSKKDFCIDMILNSLNEYFIKNKEFTVLPFILKYLKEFIKN